jgi:hypothetical protein
MDMWSIISSSDHTDRKAPMSEWMTIALWSACADLAGADVLVELRNDEGLTLTTPWTASLPPLPFDWASPPAEFRIALEVPPTHSTPIPLPRGAGDS